MAQQDRVTIQGLINLYITSNGNKEITGAQLKEILTNLNDSAFLQLDEIRTALSTSYSPATPSDWNVLPTEVKAALDEAISRVEGLENAGFQTAIQTPYTRTVPSDWDGTPNELQSSTDELAARMRVFETNNFSDSVAYVSKQGDDLTAELGNQAKPFLTLQAAVNAMLPNNSKLEVLGGGTYTELSGNLTIPVNRVNCVFDFGQCTFQGTFIYQVTAGNNGSIVKNLNINDTSGATSDIRAEFIENVNYTGTGAVGVYSKYCYNSSFVSSSSIVTVATQNIAEVHYLVACRIQNTGTGKAIRRSPNAVLINCSIESNTGIAISSEPSTDTIQEVIRLYNSEVKSSNVCVYGENGVANLIAYNTKFYSINSNIIQQGGTDFGQFLNFEGCEFYTKGALDVFNMLGTGIINRTAQENYTFKNCVFHTVTGFPISEPPSYNASDAGTTLLVNCVYTAATATSPAAVKVTEHNSYSFPNYTDFNNLQ